MAHPSPIHSQLYDLLYPADGLMLPLDKRLAGTTALLNEEARILGSTSLRKVLSDANAIRDAAALCLRDVYTDLAASSGQHVSRSSAEEGFLELIELANAARDRSEFMRNNLNNDQRAQALGTFSELGIIATVLGGVADGYYEDGFAVLGANRPRRAPGLRTDVDVRARINGKPHLLQVKTGRGKEDWIYKNGVKVVAASRIAQAGRPYSSVEQATRKVQPPAKPKRAKITSPPKPIVRPDLNLLTDVALHPESRGSYYQALTRLLS